MMKIVSGGQTGVDRGALDAALELGVPCGGWCPRGRLAEDGPIPERYPLSELDSDRYPDRTLKNVENSDGTLIIHFGELQGDTAFTRKCCIERNKAHLVMNLSDVSIEQAVTETIRFVESDKIRTLNVAGPRSSKVPQASSVAYSLVKALLERNEKTRDEQRE